MPIGARHADNLRVPACCDTGAKIELIKDLFVIMEQWMADNNNLNVRTVVASFLLCVPNNAFLRLQHIKALKYPLQPYLHPYSGLDGKLWVMKLGMPHDWEIFGLARGHRLIEGPRGQRDICRYSNEDWMIGEFVRRDGPDVSDTGRDLVTLKDEGQVFIILNDQLLERLDEFVENLTERV